MIVRSNDQRSLNANWTPSHAALLEAAARDRARRAHLRHRPGQARALPAAGRGDAAWLRKIRPWWNHHDHFHVRLNCPPGPRLRRPRPDPARRRLPGRGLVGDRRAAAARPERPEAAAEAAAPARRPAAAVRRGGDRAMRAALLAVARPRRLRRRRGQPADEPRRRGHLERGRPRLRRLLRPRRRARRPQLPRRSPTAAPGRPAASSATTTAASPTSPSTAIGPLHAIDGKPLEGERGRRRGPGRRRATAAPTSPSSISTASAATTTSTARPRAVPPHPDFGRLQHNSGLEALAIDADGTLYAIPERSGKLERPFPVYRLRDGRWDKALRLRRDGTFLVVRRRPSARTAGSTCSSATSTGSAASAPASAASTLGPDGFGGRGDAARDPLRRARQHGGHRRLAGPGGPHPRHPASPTTTSSRCSARCSPSTSSPTDPAD